MTGHNLFARSYLWQNSIFPENALNNIRTPKWSDIVHQHCAFVGNMRNLNSIFPTNALNNIRTPKRPDIVHQHCAFVGNMRNLNLRKEKIYVQGNRFLYPDH